MHRVPSGNSVRKNDPVITRKRINLTVVSLSMIIGGLIVAYYDSLRGSYTELPYILVLVATAFTALLVERLGRTQLGFTLLVLAGFFLSFSLQIVNGPENKVSLMVLPTVLVLGAHLVRQNHLYILYGLGFVTVLLPPLLQVQFGEQLYGSTLVFDFTDLLDRLVVTAITVVVVHIFVKDWRTALFERWKQAEIVAQSPDPILITDSRYIIEYVNPSFCKTFGYKQEEVIGREVTTLFGKEQKQTSPVEIKQQLERDHFWNGRFIRPTKDGTPVTVSVMISALLNESGEITNFYEFSRDISKELDLEKQLLQAQKMEVVGQLAGGVAHDFNNVLQVIYSHTQLGQLMHGKQDPATEHFSSIEAAADRASTLVQRMLAFSRQQLLQVANYDLNTDLSNTLRMIRRVIGERINLVWQPDSAIGHVVADRGQIEQVIMNLCINARDAMPDGGRLKVRTSQIHFGQDTGKRPQWAKEDEYVAIEVSDTGTGIPPEIVNRIFEPFFTTKGEGKGTGLGLSTAYGIILQHHGMLDVRSEAGKGSTFTVYLPHTVETAQQETEMDSIKASSDLSDLTVLVAEDDGYVRSTVARILEHEGCRVILAENGLIGLEKYKSHRSEITCIISDIVMPEMEGLEMYEHIQKLGTDVPVLFTSGYSGRFTLDEITDNELAFLPKPFKRQELLEKLEQLCWPQPANGNLDSA
ncbi:PAS domain S-box protein [bacterium]|nr:PAS domain S-box protein [bacterium]